jgi:poly(A) polymerase
MSPPLKAETELRLSTSNLPRLVKTLGEFFASGRPPAYLVGGVVRAALLNGETGDIDVAVAGDTRRVGAELAAFLGGQTVSIDEERGVVRVVATGDEGDYVVDLTPIEDGIHQDLSRRDFAVDAIAVPILDASAEATSIPLIDPYQGAMDLRTGVIRAVSPEAFATDPARLMRAPRLAAQLRFSIADETKEMVRRDAHLVTSVAPERLRDELLKLLAEPEATASLRLLDDLGLLCLIIPELSEAKGVTQPIEHNWDVFDHSVETVGQVERLLNHAPPQSGGFVDALAPSFDGMAEYFAQEVSDGFTRLTLTKLAGLLHDVAKPATRTVDSSGRIRFLGHHELGAQMAAAALRRLRLSRRGIDLVSRMIEQHMRPSQMAPAGEMPTSRALYRYYRDAGDAAIDTLYLNMGDYLAARGPKLSREEWADHCRIIEHILSGGPKSEAPKGPPKLIDGHDIMEGFAMAPGPRIGQLLELVREAQMSGEIASPEAAMKLVKTRLSNGGRSA